MRILVTRPEVESGPMRERLQAAGHTTLSAPLLEIEFLDPTINLDGVQALVVTSKNAVRAARRSYRFDMLRTVPVFAVGEGSAAEAIRAGFANVVRGPGTGAGLADQIAATATPGDRAVLHLSGDHVAFDLGANLAHRGFAASTIEVYRSVAVESLPDTVAEALRTETLDAVTLMSPRAAQTYTGLVTAASLRKALENVWHLCLSPAVEAGLSELRLPRVASAVRPSLEEMLALVERTAKHSAPHD